MNDQAVYRRLARGDKPSKVIREDVDEAHVRFFTTRESSSDPNLAAITYRNDGSRSPLHWYGYPWSIQSIELAGPRRDVIEGIGVTFKDGTTASYLEDI